MPEPSGPVQVSERIPTLDIVRGFALLGILIMNMPTIVPLAQLPSWQRRFAPMAAAGRMPLTNYLMQTLVATTIFYGWGFGLWGKVGPALQLVMAFAIFFVIQVPRYRLAET